MWRYSHAIILILCSFNWMTPTLHVKKNLLMAETDPIFSWCAILDIDECKEKSACQCSDCNCKNTWGSYDCSCSGDLLYMKEHDICISEYPHAFYLISRWFRLDPLSNMALLKNQRKIANWFVIQAQANLKHLCVIQVRNLHQSTAGVFCGLYSLAWL